MEWISSQLADGEVRTRTSARGTVSSSQCVGNREENATQELDEDEDEDVSEGEQRGVDC